jgi:basic membrane protein A
MNRTYTIAVVGLLIGLVIGAAIVWVAKPTPTPGPEWVSKSDYDNLDANYKNANGNLTATLAQLAALKKPIKIGLVLATGGLGDKSFNDISYAGVQRAKDELNITFDYAEPKAIAEYEGFQTNFAKTGDYALIICIGFDQADALNKTAAAYPKQNFAIVDMAVSQPNVASLLFKANEGSFLVGVISGMMTQTGKVGFVGGMDIQLINDFFLGYQAGVRWANSSVTVLNPVYVGEWANPGKGKEVAQALIDQHADAIFVAAGKSGLGALEAVHENGIIGFGVDACQDYLNPEIKASMTKRVDIAVYEMIVAAMISKAEGVVAVISKAFPNLKTDVFKGGIYNKGLKYGWTGCSRLPEEQGFWEAKFNFTEEPARTLPPNVISKLEDARDKIISGNITVPSAYP